LKDTVERVASASVARGLPSFRRSFDLF